MEIISPREAAKLLGVCVMTLRNWEKEGKLKSSRTVGGHRRFNLDEILKLRQNVKS